MEYSGSQRMRLCDHVGVLVLLALAICVPGALGSHLRSSRRLLLEAAFVPPSAQGVIPVTVPSPTSPPTPEFVRPPPPPPLPPQAFVTPAPPLHLPPAPPVFLPSAPPVFPPPPTTPRTMDPSPSLEPPPSPPSTSGTWNESEKAGVVIAAIAGMLQVAVVAFLLVKRRQIMAVVDYEDVEGDYDNQIDHGNYRRPATRA